MKKSSLEAYIARELIPHLHGYFQYGQANPTSDMFELVGGQAKLIKGISNVVLDAIYMYSYRSPMSLSERYRNNA